MRKHLRLPGEAQMLDDDLDLAVTMPLDRLDTLLVKEVPAYGGVYKKCPAHGGRWRFFLDDVTRTKLACRGFKPPCSVPADKIIGWKAVPSQEMIGGFLFPTYGIYSRSASIPNEWENPKIIPTAGMGDDVTQPTATALAIQMPLPNALLAARINEDLRVGSWWWRPSWWLFTTPASDGGVVIGIKADRKPTKKELEALPWAAWLKYGAPIRIEITPLKGSGEHGKTVIVSQPQAPDLAGCCGSKMASWGPGSMGSMGSAPVEEVIPTSSKNWHPPIDPMMGSCPVVAMPVGYLNYNVPSGYEKNPWVNKPWTLR